MQISRRSLLKFAGAGAALAALPGVLRSSGEAPAASPALARKTNCTVYRFALGDWEAFSFAAGIWDIAQPHPMFAPQASAAAFAESLDTECLTTAQFRLYFNVLLLRSGKHTLLVDTGFGPSAKSPFNLPENLAAVGIAPESVTGIFLTHAHSDHMGGLQDASGKPAFSNAELFCTAEEKAFWTDGTPDFSKSTMDAGSRDGMIANARKLFDTLPFTLIRQGTVLPDGVQAILAPGHTGGHMTLRFESKGQMLYHMADIAHHHAVMLPHPDWTVAFDANPEQAAATRKQVLARLAGEKIPVFGYHMPVPALGRIRAAGEGYRWVPRTWDPAL